MDYSQFHNLFDKHSIRPHESPILAFISGCVTTKGVDVPDFVYPDSSFQAFDTVEIDESETAFGYVCVLVPVGWKRIIYFVANRKVVTWAIMLLSHRL